MPSRGDFPKLDTSYLSASLRTLPSAVDLSAGLPPIGSQGSQASCVGWALAYYYKTFQEKQERGWGVSTTEHQFSPAWVYNQRSTSDCTKDRGMSYYDGFTILSKYAAAPLSSFPYDPQDSCTRPSESEKDEAWQYRIDSFENVFAGQGRANIAELKALLANGEPFAIAAPVYYPSFYSSTSGDPFLVPVHDEDDTLFGGHAMFVVGYDDTIGGFLTVNSWGAAWGNSGFCYLSYDFVQYDCWEAWVMNDHIESTPPATFRGNIVVNGVAVAEGTAVAAWIADEQIASTTTSMESGRSVYTLSIPGDDPETQGREGGNDGELVRFKVRSSWADETGTWQQGSTVDQDLRVQNLCSGSKSSWIEGFGSLQGGWSSQDRYPRMLADVNGDGRADIVGFEERGVYVALSTGSDFAPESLWLADFQAKEGGWSSQNQYPRVLADVNGDGKADIVGFWKTGVKVSLSTGSSFSPSSRWLRGFCSQEGRWSSQDQYPRTLGDVNGDGKADIVGFHPQKGAKVALSAGNGFAKPTCWTRQFRWLSQDERPRMLADVNNDGLADIVGFHSMKGEFVALSTGNSFAKRKRWSRQFRWPSQDEQPRMLADVNNDGKADIFGFHSTKGVFVALSTGNGFAKRILWNREFRWGSQDERPRMMTDVTNDGKADIVGFGDDATYVAVTVEES